MDRPPRTPSAFLVRAALLGALVFVAADRLPAWACAFCSPSPLRPSLQQELAGHARAALARAAVDADGELRLRVTSVLRGGPDLEAGTALEVLGRVRLKADTTYLALHDGSESAASRVLELSPQAAAFANRLAALPAPDPAGSDGAAHPELLERRLSFVLERLGEADQVIADAVLHEFAQAPYGAVAALRPRLSAEVLVEALWDPRTPVAQFGLLYLLLGIEGSEEARAELRASFDSAHARMRPGFDGLLGALILVEGSSGLRSALDARPPEGADPSRKRWYAGCLVSALEFHLRDEDAVPEPELLAAAHTLLEDKVVAAQAIGLLLRLERWGSLPQVAAARRAFALERPSVERATRAFLSACPGDEAARILAEPLEEGD